MSSSSISSSSIVSGWIGSISSFTVFVAACNLVYCYYKLLYNNNNIEAIKNRRPMVVLIACILICIYLFSWIFISLGLFGVFNISNKEDYSTAFWATLSLMSVLLTIITPLYLLCYRGCRVYYDIKFNQALQDEKWRLYIDPTETNWYLKNKNKWGSGKRIAIILSTIYLLLAVPAVFSSILSGKNDKKVRYLTALNLLIPIISSLILYCKFPKFDDIWKIRKESKLLSLTSSIPTILYLFLGPTTGIQPPHPLYVIFVFVGFCISSSIVGATMFYVLIKFNLPTNIYSYHKFLKYSTNSNNVYHSDNRKRRNSLTIKMNDILQTENGFNLFARHLTKEFAVENLLFFVETQQWLNYILSFKKHKYEELIKLNDNDQQFTFNTLLSVKFPDNAPKTKIITSSMNVDGVVMNVQNVQNVDSSVSSTKSDNDMNDFYISSVKLFKKYIIENAYFTINISSEQRSNLYNLFGGITVNKDINIMTNTEMVSNLKKNNIDLKNLIHIFNEARYETYQLMWSGFCRFKISEEFVSNFDKFKNQI